MIGPLALSTIVCTANEQASGYLRHGAANLSGAPAAGIGRAAAAIARAARDCAGAGFHVTRLPSVCHTQQMRGMPGRLHRPTPAFACRPCVCSRLRSTGRGAPRARCNLCRINLCCTFYGQRIEREQRGEEVQEEASVARVSTAFLMAAPRSLGEPAESPGGRCSSHGPESRFLLVARAGTGIVRRGGLAAASPRQPNGRDGIACTLRSERSHSR
jgi:hypothetical protein